MSYIIMPNDALTKVLIGIGMAKLIGKLSDNLIANFHKICTFKYLDI